MIEKIPQIQGMKQIAIFKPYNTRLTTAFYGAQHTLFRYLNQCFGYEFTYFVDDPSVRFEGVRMAYVPKSSFGTLLTGAYKLLVSDGVRYPFYWKVGLEDFDAVITEGIYYSLLHYVRHCAAKVILNDSLSRDPGFRPGRARYLNKYFRQSQAVLVTERVRAVYEAYDIDIPTEVIGHPVDACDIAFKTRSTPARRLLSVGRLVEGKGFEFIIEATTQVARRHPEVTLDIFGVGPLAGRLQRMVRDRGMESRIRFQGYVGREDLLGRFGTYDLFVSHPVTTPRSVEAFLMANMEAMASGLPVITSDCGGVPYVVKDRAVVIRQRDVRSLDEAIEGFVAGAARMDVASVSGRRFVEDNYALNVIGLRWQRVIEKVLHGRH